MATINFKTLIQKDAAGPVRDLLHVIGSSVGVTDVRGTLLAGQKPLSGGGKFPVTLSGKTIGFVEGENKAFAVASLLSHLAHVESEKKELRLKALDMDEEICLIRDVGEKMAHAQDVGDVAMVVVDEATAHIECTGASVMLLNEENNNLEIVAAFGKKFSQRPVLKPGVGIVGEVMLTGDVEVVPDVTTDARWVPGPNKICSLMCVPVKIGDEVLGAVNVSCNTPTNFRDFDVKLVTNLACQAAVAVKKIQQFEAMAQDQAAEPELVEEALPPAPPLPCEVPEKILQVLNFQDGRVPEAGEAVRRTMSAMVVDIRSFSEHSSTMDEKQNFRFLCQFAQCIEQALQKHNGICVQWTGDGQLALFGDQGDDSADRALSAAIEIQKNVVAFSRKREDNLQMPVSAGLGISTGMVSVGVIGFDSGLLPTVIGDPVLIGARLERLTKRYGIKVAIGDRTRRALNNPGNYLIREVDNVEISYQGLGFTVYEVFDADPKGIREAKIQNADMFDRALHLYRHKEFADAGRIFADLKIKMPFDLVQDIYSRRCAAYLKSPPPDTWVGVTRLTEL